MATTRLSLEFEYSAVDVRESTWRLASGSPWLCSAKSEVTTHPTVVIAVSEHEKALTLMAEFALT
jgi:hypothetical protein